MIIKCYICNHEMEKIITSIDTLVNGKDITIDDIEIYKCPNCEEIVLDSKEVIRLQK